MQNMTNSYLPRLGEFVKLAGKEDWGIGQVQSVIGMKVTINFPESGKQVINIENANLVAVDIDNDVS